MNCCICNETYNVVTELNCNHKFCIMCISKWFLNKNTCPLCRRIFNLELLNIKYYVEGVKTRSQKKDYNINKFVFDLIKFTHYIKKLTINHKSNHYINSEMRLGFNNIIMNNIDLIISSKNEWINELLEYLFVIKSEQIYAKFLKMNKHKYDKFYRYIINNLNGGNELPL